MIPLPEAVAFALMRLRGLGREAYPVGGCVRDCLLGKAPEDWDLCTSARPEETLAAFSDCRTLPTGLKHGTVTVLYAGRSLEITTFRRDGTYSDHRRPDGVSFVSCLEEDLARRDFTVNAMALAPEGTVIDPFGGREDLKNGLLRCVGEPETRFREDALRILRLLRFASRLGFQPEKETLAAALRCRELLPALAGERVLKELCLWLAGDRAGETFPWAKPLLEPVLPELGELDAEAEARTLDRLPPDPALGFGLLLRSSEGRKADALRRLKGPKALENRVRALAAAAFAGPPETAAALGLMLGRLGERDLRSALELWRVLETGPEDKLDALERELDRRVAAGFCYTFRDLALTGGDLAAIGHTGPEIGAIQRSLLERVQTGELENEKAALLAETRNHRERSSR